MKEVRIAQWFDEGFGHKAYRDRIADRKAAHSVRAELWNLYHLARTALDNPSSYERKCWAAREFNKLHPEISRTWAYLCFEGERVSMKEVRIICGVINPKTGHPVNFATFEDILAREFGGFTKIQGTGGLLTNNGVVHEPVEIFDVAIGHSAEEEHLMALVRALARRANQLRIYFRGTDGVVRFVGPNEP